MTFKKHRDSDERKKSAIVAIDAILAMDIYPPHKRKLLSKCIWFLTEADGKLKTQFCSESALAAPKKSLRHEHVFIKKRIIDELLKPGCDVDELAKLAIGCIVTIDEHAELHSIDKALNGWKRYAAAKVKVIDRATGNPIPLT